MFRGQVICVRVRSYVGGQVICWGFRSYVRVSGHM